MNRNWLKRGVFFGIIGIVAYFFVEFFLIDFLAEQRFHSDKNRTIENFKTNESVLEEIRLKTLDLPDFMLYQDEFSQKIIYFYNEKLPSPRITDSALVNHIEVSFSSFSTNHLIDKIKDPKYYPSEWTFVFETINIDSIFQKKITAAKENLSQFETIFNLMKSANCLSTSKKEKYLKIDFINGGLYNAGFRYISFNKDLKDNTLDEHFIGKKLNEHFYWEFYDEALIYLIHPTWIPN